MSNKTISGVVADSQGATTPFSGTINITDSPVINSVVVSPDPAPVGTMRTITITATDPQGLALTYTCLVDGIAATPVTGQPNKFTVTV